MGGREALRQYGFGELEDYSIRNFHTSVCVDIGSVYCIAGGVPPPAEKQLPSEGYADNKKADGVVKPAMSDRSNRGNVHSRRYPAGSGWPDSFLHASFIKNPCTGDVPVDAGIHRGGCETVAGGV